jgi:hypothetical protein
MSTLDYHEEVQTLTGHKTPSTLDRYIGITTDDALRLARAARSAVAKGGQPPQRIRLCVDANDRNVMYLQLVTGRNA